MGSGFSIKARGKEADILIYEEVGEGWFGGVTAKQFVDDLKAVGSVDTINLRINSPGGDVFDGLAIYRRLVEHKARIVTHIDGLAASIASIIAMAGDEIRMSESGQFMIHDAWGFAIGNSAEMRSVADRLEMTTTSLRDVYVARTKNDPDKVKDWMAKETWFTASEAVANGFADSVVDNFRVAAAAYDLNRFKFRNAPKTVPVTNNLDDLKRRVARMKSLMERRKAAAA